MIAQDPEQVPRISVKQATAAAIAFALAMLVISSEATAQKRIVVHAPQARLELEGLLRRTNLSLAHYSLEVHPGWLVSETFDSLAGVTNVLCTDPSDSLVRFLEAISHPADGKRLNKKQWSELKDQLRSGYGERKIGTRVLFDTTMIGSTNSHGVQAIFEVLARRTDRLEFAATIVTTRETILLTADIPNDDYLSKIAYYRSIAEGIHETR